MTIVNKIKALSDRIPALKDHLETEEATKNALVMPFIAALGWDVFNPAEVIRVRSNFVDAWRHSSC